MQTDFRKASEADIPAMMAIIDQGKAYLKQQGVPQWQKGEPNPAMLAQDVAQGEAYVLVAKGQAAATLALLMREEAAYNTLAEGAWGSNAPYAAIHRIAIDSAFRGQGLSGILMRSIEDTCRQADIFSIRVDTHRQNLPMQQYLQKNGFVRRGSIVLPDGAEAGAERIVFDKQLNK